MEVSAEQKRHMEKEDEKISSSMDKIWHRIVIFSGKGDGEKQAKEMDVLFLGALPLNIETIALADKGKPIIIEKPEADISIAMMKIIGRIQNIFTD